MMKRKKASKKTRKETYYYLLNSKDFLKSEGIFTKKEILAKFEGLDTRKFFNALNYQNLIDGKYCIVEADELNDKNKEAENFHEHLIDESATYLLYQTDSSPYDLLLVDKETGQEQHKTWNSPIYDLNGKKIDLAFEYKENFSLRA